MSLTIAESCSLTPSLATDITLVSTEKYYCPFLERGFCRDLSRCNFSHDCQASIKIPTDYCHFYLANQCLFGLDCKFLHREPNGDNTLFVGASFNQTGVPHSSCGDHDDSFNNNTESHNNDDLSEQHQDFRVNANSTYVSFDHDKEDGSQHSPGQNQDHCEDRDEAGSTRDDGNNNLNQRQYNLSDRSNPQNGNDQPSSSKFRALRISNRCAMTTPSTSTTLLSRLKLPTNAGAQGSSKMFTNSDSKTSASSTSNKNSWQGARLIASIRNNLGIGNQADSYGVEQCDESSNNNEELGLKDMPMCPYSQASGECPFPEGHCNYLHGLVCDLCYSACLHPHNEEQRHNHREECLREHEREMELSFAVQRSKDKVCGICMDMVVEKKPVTSSRFGILEKCNHIFCLDCIRKWRGTKQFDSRTIRACPECRVSSDFVVPSKYWVEDQEDKTRLINTYKAALKSKPCRYFNEGKGECPFAGSCFYKHAYPDGRLAIMEAPKPRRRLYGARGPTSSVANLILWNILTSTDEDDLSDDEIQSLYDLDDEFLNSDDEADPYWARDYDDY